ncbi:uncharacterized protein LOC128727009 [Anopheles nili]|uniref:uncharacterized protein LOC128727009 n=1 Tax=Anopheles nili TaxID=185578 RepID=UPI00237B76A7|nr:uncharacterized protein LOC128727009 [Anopheles nili]
MHSLIVLVPVCLAVASGGYVEHYQGATSFSSIDLPSVPFQASKLTLSNPSTVAVIKDATDHAPFSKIVTYEPKPAISAVYAAPIAKTLTYGSAPVQYASSHHYDVPAPAPECTLKEHKLIVPVQTAVPVYGAPVTASHSLWGQSGSSGQSSHGQLATQTISHSYKPISSELTQSPAYASSFPIGGSLTHHYSAPASSVIYSPPKVSFSAGSQHAFTSGHQSTNFGVSKGYGGSPTPIVHTLVDVAPSTLVHKPATSSFGISAQNPALHLVSQPSYTPAKISSSSSYQTTAGGWKESNSGYATSHQYQSSSVPIKTSLSYVAPAIKAPSMIGTTTFSGNSGWKGSNVGQTHYSSASESSKSQSQSFATSNSYYTPTAAITQQYLPPKTTVSVPAAIESFGASSTSHASSVNVGKDTPSREYLPAREYLPPVQENKGATTATSTAHVGVTPLKITSSKVPQQARFHVSSQGAQYGIVSPLHVSVHKTPILAPTLLHDCAQDHQRLH